MVEDEIIEKLDLWKDKDFVAELDRRIEELESGKIKGVTMEEMKSKF